MGPEQSGITPSPATTPPVAAPARPAAVDAAMQSTQIPVDTGNVNPAGRRVEPVHRVNPTANHLRGADSETIKEEIRQTRSKMDETLEQLEQRLRPVSLLNDTISYFTGDRTDRTAGDRTATSDRTAAPSTTHGVVGTRRSSGDDNGPAVDLSELTQKLTGTAAVAGDLVGDFGQQILQTVRRHPVGSLLVSSGLAYMAVEARKSDSATPSEGHRRRPVGPHADYSHDPGPEIGMDHCRVSNTGDPTIGDDDSNPSSGNAHGLLQSSPDVFGSVAEDRTVHPIDPDQVDVDIENDQSYSQRIVIPDYAGNVEHSLDDSSTLPITNENEDMTRTHDINRMANQNRQTYRSQPGGNNAGGYGNHDEDQSIFSSAAESIREAARSTYLRTRATARDLQSAAGNTPRPSGEFARRGGEKFRTARNEFPLAVGLGFAAVGALAGLMIPRTRKEDEWMGQQSDALKDQFRETASSATNTVTTQSRQALLDVKEQTLGAVSEKGLDKDSLIERAKAVVAAALTEGQQSLLEMAEKEGLTPEQLTANAKAVLSEAAQTAKQHADQAKSELAQTAEEVKQQADAKTDELAGKVTAKTEELQQTAAEKIDQAQSVVDRVEQNVDEVRGAAQKGADVVTETDVKVQAKVEVDTDEKTDRDAMEISQNWSDQKKSVPR